MNNHEIDDLPEFHGEIKKSSLEDNIPAQGLRVNYIDFCSFVLMSTLVSEFLVNNDRLGPVHFITAICCLVKFKIGEINK